MHASIQSRPAMPIQRPSASGGSLLALVLAALAATASSARAAEMMSAAHATIRAADAGRHVHTLADDAFEGREGGSRGGRAAGAYVVEQLGRLRLQPAGDAGSYYQSFGGMRNILAILPGADPTVARELVVVSAHYDHVGYGNASNSYGPFGYVHNGADDNASGVAGLLEVAEALERLSPAPRRSILIAFWDGEEKGLLGSRHFLRTRPATLAGMQIVACVNLDMIGRLRDRRLEVYGTRSATGLRSAVVAANNDAANAAGLELAFDWDMKEESDHYAFVEARVPTVMFHTGLHDQYHRPADDAHLVNLEGIEPVARLTLGIVRALAEEPGPPRPFRAACRAESNADKRRLEAAVAASTTSTRGRWGIGTRADPGEPSAPVVVRIAPASPAAAAGLRAGDRIVTVAGDPCASQEDAIAKLRAAGATVALGVERRGRVLPITLDEEGRRGPVQP